ncbi:MAG: nucleotide exchange factor GrpE [Immundisolibacteraceae bacterium]|nr:nucleotide exchange factor GrpE [Immundisolibacteraceae bacterium]
MEQQTEASGSKNDAGSEVQEGEVLQADDASPEAPVNPESDQGEASTEAPELTLEEQLQAARDEANELRDASLRAVAEQENLRRRTQRDVQNAHKFGAEKILRELVEVADNLEAALASEDSGGEGVKMTLDLLLKTFEKNQVVVVSPEGELFDPELHQAMTMQPTDEVEANHVLQVIQKGYRLHDRLLRPAMVVVAKAPE